MFMFWTLFCKNLVESYASDFSQQKTHQTSILLITHELVEAKKHLEKLRMEADVANKMRLDFLASMNHELRTPLNAIIGFAQMMEKQVHGEVGNEKYSSYVEYIQKSGLELLRKINDLVDMASINAGNMQLEESAHDIVSVIREALSLNHIRANSHKVDLRPCLTLKPIYFQLDRMKMLHIINNLLANAIIYNTQGGHVDIYSEKRKDGGVNIVIQDSGQGVSASKLQQIKQILDNQERFVQRNRESCGMGIAISHELIKLHQGKIEMESGEGKGTTVKIILPAHRKLKNPSSKRALEKI